MSLVIDMLCRDGIIVGCDSRVTLIPTETPSISKSNIIEESYDLNIPSKIYDGGNFILASVGDKNIYAKIDGVVISFTLFDIGDTLKDINHDPKNLPHDLVSILKRYNFRTFSKTILLYYCVDGIYNRYIFRSEDNHPNEFSIILNKDLYQSYGCCNKLSNALLSEILSTKYDEPALKYINFVDYSKKYLNLADCVPIVKSVLESCINLLDLSLNSGIGFPIHLYTLNQNGTIEKLCGSYDRTDIYINEESKE